MPRPEEPLAAGGTRVSRTALLPLLHVPLFVGLSAAWMAALSFAVAVWLIASGRVTSALSPTELLDATWTGLVTIVQILGMGAIALGLALLLPCSVPPLLSLPTSGAELAERLREAMALRRSPWPWTLAALLGASVMWTLASWIATELMELFPDWPSTMEQIGELLSRADPVGFVVLGFAIAVTAPLFEELIFRGYVWRVLELGLGRGAAFVGSTLLFAMYHLDPLHVVALLPTALFFGWLRLRSGSLIPPVLAHFVNNALALALSAAPTDPSAELPLWIGIGGYAVGLVIVAGAELLTRGRRP